jgi:negative regulator of sigma E activity
MTESIQDQISAFIDGELAADETEFLLRRLSHDRDARRQLKSYLAIGAAVRGDLIGDRAVDLSDSLRTAMDGNVAEEDAAIPARAWWRIAKPIAGVAIAASVALAALFLVRGPEVPGVPVAQVDAPPVEATAYVVPTVQEQNVIVRPQLRLTNYLVSHGQYTSSLGRQLINSSVVAYEESREPEKPAAKEEGPDSE